MQKMQPPQSKTSAVATLMAPLCLLAWVTLGGVAAAHTVLLEASAPAGETYYRARFQVTHGCGESPTHTIRVLIPDDVDYVSVWHKPDWIVKTVRAPSTSDDGQLGRVKEVVWTGSKLPADEYDYFEIEVGLPDEVGRVLYFKTIQICDEGDLRWIEVPAKGKSAEDYESPAPSLTLTAH